MLLFHLLSFPRFNQVKQPIVKRGGFWCFTPPPGTGCPVHMGICSAESSFGLVEADAVVPLVRVLGEPDLGACEAALRAVLTLFDGEQLHSGSKVLSGRNAITPIIRLLSSPSINVQEKALHALERICWLIEFKQKYGASSRMPLVDIRGEVVFQNLWQPEYSLSPRISKSKKE